MNIEEHISKFYNENKASKFLLSKEDSFNKTLKFNSSTLYTKKDLIAKHIDLNKILLTINDLSSAIIISDNKFIIVSAGFKNICNSYSLDEFHKVGGFPKGMKKGFITFDGSNITSVATSKNELFDLIKKFQYALSNIEDITTLIDQTNDKEKSEEKEDTIGVKEMAYASAKTKADMEDFEKVLFDFYEENKDNEAILSPADIKKTMEKWLSINNYKVHKTDYIKFFDQIIFGTKNGMCFTKLEVRGVDSLSEGEKWKMNAKTIIYKFKIEEVFPLICGPASYRIKKYAGNMSSNQSLLISKLNTFLIPHIEQYEIDKKRNLEEKEQQKIEKFNKSQDNVLKELDKDGNGEVDLVEGNDFSLLLKKHQKRIIEIDRTYVQQFVKVSSYLKTKKNNVQLIFNSIKDTSNEEELNEYVGILKNEIHSYSLILFNSLNMIVSLVEDDMITFYEIHEAFDKLNMFSSNWENEISQKLSDIGDGLSNLMYSIEEMGQNIVNEIGHLSYVTEESNQMLSNQLQDIDSSLQTNNLLTGIQTYQMYKINKNTKGLRE